MEENVFARFVKEYFAFLVREFGFAIVHESYNPKAFGNSEVRFESKTAGIRLIRDRGDVTLTLGRPSEPPNSWLDLTTVAKFLQPEAQEPVYIFPDFPGQPERSMDFQLSRLAPLLRRYCGPILRGHFSSWQQLRQFEAKRAEELTKEAVKKSGRSDYPHP